MVSVNSARRRLAERGDVRVHAGQPVSDEEPAAGVTRGDQKLKRRRPVSSRRAHQIAFSSLVNYVAAGPPNAVAGLRAAVAERANGSEARDARHPAALVAAFVERRVPRKPEVVLGPTDGEIARPVLATTVVGMDRDALDHVLLAVIGDHDPLVHAVDDMRGRDGPAAIDENATGDLRLAGLAAPALQHGHVRELLGVRDVFRVVFLWQHGAREGRHDGKGDRCEEQGGGESHTGNSIRYLNPSCT